MEDICVVCGETIPEGTQVCPACWNKIMKGDTNENNKISKPRI